ncbi:MAG: ROK family protein [Actinomycetota bacterium]
MPLVAGVDIGGTKVLAALVNEDGRIMNSVQRSTDPEAGTASLISGLGDLLSSVSDDPVTIGVGVAGWVEHPSGRVVFAPNLHYEVPDIARAVSEKFDVPVTVENDANCAAWAEHRFGAGRGVAEMLMLAVGTGVGGGIVIGGSLYRGNTGLAAEFGHMTIVDGGPVCACGQRGCLEALSSGPAIARMAREGVGGAGDSILLELTGGNPSKITGALVNEAARAMDEFSIGILERAGRSLGVGLAALINAFDPGLVVIGGGGAEAGDYLLEPARIEIRGRLSGRDRVPEVVTGTLGAEAGVIGAADLARIAAGLSG